jgi:hypothetical protein
LDVFTGQVCFVAKYQKTSPYYQLVQLWLLYILLPMLCIALLEQQIDWPNLWWKLLSLCGSNSKPELTYLDQMIPTPMNLCVPNSWTDLDILFCVVPSMGPMEVLRPLSLLMLTGISWKRHSQLQEQRKSSSWCIMIGILMHATKYCPRSRCSMPVLSPQQMQKTYKLKWWRDTMRIVGFLP